MRKREGGRRENRSWRSVVKMIFSVKEEDYKLTKEIGKGASATVYKAIYLPLEKVVAVKCLDLERCNSNLVSTLLNESISFSLIPSSFFFYVGVMYRKTYKERLKL